MSDDFFNFPFAGNELPGDRLGIGDPIFRSLPSTYGDQVAGASDGSGEPGESGDQVGQGQEGSGHTDRDRGDEMGGQGSSSQDGQEADTGQGAGDPGDEGKSPSLTPEDVARRGLSPEEITQLQRSLADDIANAASAGAGNALPEGTVEWAAEFLLPPMLPLHDLFQIKVGECIDASRQGARSTYRRRSRRQDAVGGRVMLPGKARHVTEVMVGIDVSGSRSDEELARDFSEITAVAESKGFRVTYFSVSTVHHEIREVHRGDQPVFDRDGAGTDMRMAFEVFDAHNARARILMTDGYTPWPASVRAGTETIVAITSYSEEDYLHVCQRLPQGLESVWLPPAGVEGRPGI